MGQGPEELLEPLSPGRTQLGEHRTGRSDRLADRQRVGVGDQPVPLAGGDGDPQVLVLDEPANGLDPDGIYWMRGLLRGFADRGGTVLLSSHLLREVEAVADQLVVISAGRVVARGSKQELLGGRGTVARGPDRALLERALRTAGISVAPGEGDALVADADPLAVGRAVSAAGVVLTELRPAGGEGLEELFRSLTSGDGSQQVQEVAA